MNNTIEITEHDFNEVNHAAGVFGMMAGLKVAKEVLRLAKVGDLDGATAAVKTFAKKIVKLTKEDKK